MFSWLRIGVETAPKLSVTVSFFFFFLENFILSTGIIINFFFVVLVSRVFGVCLFRAIEIFADFSHPENVTAIKVIVAQVPLVLFFLLNNFCVECYKCVFRQVFFGGFRRPSGRIKLDLFFFSKLNLIAIWSSCTILG